MEFDYTNGQLTITMPSNETVGLSLDDAVTSCQDKLDRSTPNWAAQVKAGGKVDRDFVGVTLCEDLASEIDTAGEFELAIKLMEDGFPDDLALLSDVCIALSRKAAGYHASAGHITGTGMAPVAAAVAG